MVNYLLMLPLLISQIGSLQFHILNVLDPSRTLCYSAVPLSAVCKSQSLYDELFVNAPLAHFTNSNTNQKPTFAYYGLVSLFQGSYNFIFLRL